MKEESKRIANIDKVTHIYAVANFLQNNSRREYENNGIDSYEINVFVFYFKRRTVTTFNITFQFSSSIQCKADMTMALICVSNDSVIYHAF